MRSKFVAAAVLASLFTGHLANAQTTIFVPSGQPIPPNSPTPLSDPDDTPESIARDAARDLRDTRFYNRPGATRAQYDAAWQECRMIARGSRTPTGTIPTFYNPAVSPLAAGIGGALGGLIAGAIAEGEQRRANRRNCLLIRGWRLVEVPPVQAARVQEMTDEQRSAYLDTIVGAEQVEGTITERTSFSLAPDPALRLDAPVVLPGSIVLGRGLDSASPLAIAPEEGAIVFAFRRPDEGSAGRTGEVHFARYDVEARDLVYRPRDWRRRGDNTTYHMAVISRNRRAPLEVHVLKVTPGDYVIAGHVPGLVPVTNSFCFGAPTFRVEPGQVVYVGDFIPFMNARLSTGERLTQIAYTSHIDDTRRTLAVQQPSLAAALTQATLRNGATFACAAVTMDRWDLPGVDSLPPPTPTAASADSTDPVPAANP